MKLRMWQIDAFAGRPFEGNPAAIVPLKDWLNDTQMQAIANENNLAETAFFVEKSPGLYHLRWFTPVSEVALCGHATLASGWLIFAELAPSLSIVKFETKSGVLEVERSKDGNHRMALPADPMRRIVASDDFDKKLGKALGVRTPNELYLGRYLMAVWDDADAVRAINPQGDFVSLLRKMSVWGLIATGRGDGKPYDCVSRFFAPDKGVYEDPVTGSAHCAIIPYWAKHLGKKTLRARQASPRGGDLTCVDDGARVILSGPCALYLKGEIEV